MAFFRYLGDPLNIVLISGPCIKIKIPKQDGTIMIIDAPDQINGFPIGQVINTDISDPRSLRIMRADHRFLEEP